MSSYYTEFEARNAQYASTFGAGKSLSMMPEKRVIIVSCMDHRADPAHFLGLKPGEAVVIRVAGGSVREVVRSLVICQRFTGAKEIALFRHTNCGGLTFTAESLRELILSAHPGDKEVAEAVEKVDLSGVTDVEDALNADLKFLHEHPLVLKDTLITGWIFDVETGKIRRSL